MTVSYLTIAQCMAAAAFLAMAVVHLLVWSRVRSEINHLLFAITLTAAAANALAEANMYRSDSIGTMAVALRWYVTTSGLWAIATRLVHRRLRAGHSCRPRFRGGD